MKKILLLLLVTFLSFYSCTTYKWKVHYVNNKVADLLIKYSVDTEYNYTVPIEGNLKTLRLSSRKQVKKTVSGMEKIFALIPDSICPNKLIMDSLYSNENKIYYIKKHRLQSLNIHFFEKN